MNDQDKNQKTETTWPWANLREVAPSVEIDLVYAKSENVFGRSFYKTSEAYLKKPVAEALESAAKSMKEQGFQLVLLDGYRPWSATKEMWEMAPEKLKSFVAHPDRGSRHNRGAAVDVSLKFINSDQWAPMPSLFDEFSDRAHADYVSNDLQEMKNREALKSGMISHGFIPLSIEWWHFDFPGWETQALSDLTLSEIESSLLLDS